MERLSRLSGVSGVEMNATTFWSRFPGLEKGPTPEVSGIASLRWGGLCKLLRGLGAKACHLETQ